MQMCHNICGKKNTMDVMYPIEYFNLWLLMGHGRSKLDKMNSKVDSRFQDDRTKRNTISYEMK